MSNVDKHSVEGHQPVRLCNYVDVYKNETIHDGLPFMEATASDSQIRLFSLMVGDTVITKDSETADDIGVAAFVGATALNLVCGYHLAIIRPDPLKVSPKYLFWALKSNAAAAQWEVKASGVTRVGLRSSDLKTLSVMVPDGIPRQAAIADFLDRETAKIDALIDKQAALAEGARARRASTIYESVTGKDSPGRLRDSGVRWLGRCPEHWSVGNIRRFAAMKTGHTPSRTHPEYWADCGIPWFTLADVWQLRAGRMYLGETSELISRLGLANSAAELLPKGTVILSRTASVGFVGIMPRPMATSQDFWNWVAGPGLTPEYLYFVLMAMRSEYEALRMGSTHQTIYKGDAASFQIPVPPLSEQQAIVSRLLGEIASVDTLVGRTERAIQLAKERRSALITAAVTGQLDIPGEAA